MKYVNYRFVSMLMLVGLLLAACGARAADPEIPTEEDAPAKVEHLDGANPTRVTLTEDAVKRLDIQTAQVSGNTIPYDSVLYDTEGNTWVYLNPEPFVFLRAPVTVDHIEGGKAFLSKGPSSGSAVVTIGAEELYGSETEFEEE